VEREEILATSHFLGHVHHEPTGLYIPDNCFGPDLSFLNKKVKPDSRVHIPRFFCFDKQTSRTQVSDS
jgi:hypothetical protein